MSKLKVEGGNPLCGVVDIQGAKNSVLPILAATLVSDGECVIEGCPDIRDTHTAIEILEALGARVTKQPGYMTIDASSAGRYEIPDHLMRKMRSSIMFLGAILTRNRRALATFPGGCELGQRPIDLHLSALRKLGVQIDEAYGVLDCRHDGLKGCEITLTFPSVGATENVMLAAVKAEGLTILNNPAKEPEIEDLQSFLNKMGARISGAGSSRIVIQGVKKLSGVTYRSIPDRIVAATYMCAVAGTRGNALFKNVVPQHLSAVLSLLSDAGCEIRCYEDSVSLECSRLRSVNPVRTMPYPGFPTDAQAPFMALMARAEGTSVFVETIFENRYKHVGELVRMGANITAEGRVAVVNGVKRLYGAPVEAFDLRGGAALVVAGLCAEGETVVSNAEHIYRGYENLIGCIGDLGGKISAED